MNREYDELLQAYKKNKHTAHGERLHAVCMIKINGDTIADTARRMFCSYQSVSNWLEAYESWGIEGLKDLPRSGDVQNPSPHRR